MTHLIGTAERRRGPRDGIFERPFFGLHDPSASTIAVVTAVLATAGALFSYMAGATQANTGLFKNNAAIKKKTEASNQWNDFQAKSSKQNLAEIAIVLAPEDRRTGFKDEFERYKQERTEIKAAARKT